MLEITSEELHEYLIMLIKFVYDKEHTVASYLMHVLLLHLSSLEIISKPSTCLMLGHIFFVAIKIHEVLKASSFFEQIKTTKKKWIRS